MRKSCNPEPSQPLFFCGNSFFNTCGCALTECELCVQFGAQFSDA